MRATYREREKAGVRNEEEEEKTLVPGSADGGSEKALYPKERERERTEGFFEVIYLDFIFIAPRHAKVTIYRFFVEPWQWMCNVFAFCDATKSLMTIREGYPRPRQNHSV